MSKIVLVLVVIAAVAQGYPANEDLAAAAASGDWDTVHRLINERFNNDKDIWEPIPSGNVKSLKPIKGGHVYGESEYTFRQATDINGKKMETSGGHRVVNNDGKVQEYDFKPKSISTL